MGRHINIELLTLSELEEVKGDVGNFQVKVRQQPRYVDMDKCIACGACIEKCPKKVDDAFNFGLNKRKAIHVKFSQAVPLKYAIDPQNCIYLTKGKCKVCSKVCPTGAINYEDTEKVHDLNVGAVIVALGAQWPEQELLDVYGYTRHKNVMTHLEFERALSASGPFMGHIKNMVTGEAPKKIAWVQCVGSRDTHDGARSYCSTACCSFAIKQAVIAQEHAHDPLDTTIFYIDIRTQGKDVERYYNRAKELGVNFVKGRIASVEPKQDGALMGLTYVDDCGKRITDDYDLVILSLGTCPNQKNVDMLKNLGIEMRDDNYPVLDSFSPVETNLPGIMIAGYNNAPKEIPMAVVDASACAGKVGTLLSQARGTETKTQEVTPEIDVAGDQVKVGVFVCNCGSNIAGVVDCPNVEEYASGLPNVAHTEQYLFACSQDAQDKMAQVIKEKGLNRIVVAACTPRTHEPLFQETMSNAGLNKYLFEMANIRNQCSWVHSGEPEQATRKAKDLIRMGVAKASLLRPLQEQELNVSQKALVVGGGAAGMTAAVNLAEQGFLTYLVEKENQLGGNARRLAQTWKGEDAQAKLGQLINKVTSSDKIEVLLGATISDVDGFVGNFETTIEVGGQDRKLEHGAVIVATGATEWQPDGWLYGDSDAVCTGLELDEKLIAGDPALGGLKSVAFMQCVGSRTPDRPYCSKTCCTHSVTNAIALKERNQDTDVYILYRDMRTYGLREASYRKARELGVRFIRYDNDKGVEVTPDGSGVKLAFKDLSLGADLSLKADLMVLASAAVPPAENTLAQMLKLPQNLDGFYQEAHIKLRPVDFANDGVFLCGLSHSPMSIDECIAQAQAAASHAAVVLSTTELHVGGVVAEVDAAKCVGCGVCAEVCPYKAITINDDGKAEVNEAICKGCGTCSAACRSGAASLKGFTEADVMAQINAL